jgi:hypothetical protein
LFPGKRSIDRLERTLISEVIVVVLVIEDIALALMRPLKEVILIVADTESVIGMIETEIETGTENEEIEIRNGTANVIKTERKIELVIETLKGAIAPVT